MTLPWRCCADECAARFYTPRIFMQNARMGKRRSIGLALPGKRPANDINSGFIRKGFKRDLTYSGFFACLKNRQPHKEAAVLFSAYFFAARAISSRSRCTSQG